MNKKSLLTFLSVWLVSSIANSSVGPEIVFLEKERSASSASKESLLLQELQKITFDLQVFDLTLKNKRDEKLEQKISNEVKKMELDGALVSRQFANLRQIQMDHLFLLFNICQKYAASFSIGPKKWANGFKKFKEDFSTSSIDQIAFQMDESKIIPFLSVQSLQMGKEKVFKFFISEGLFWKNLSARDRLRVQKELAAISSLHDKAQGIAHDFFNKSYSRLSHSFEDYRFILLERMTQARKNLLALSKMNSSMGTSSQYSDLYNSILDNLYSYGIDFSMNGPERMFKLNGFIFGDDPKGAEVLMKKLRFSASTDETFNSPSS